MLVVGADGDHAPLDLVVTHGELLLEVLVRECDDLDDLGVLSLVFRGRTKVHTAYMLEFGLAC